MSSRHKILFIINPISGIGKKNKLPELIDKYIDSSKIDIEIAYTKHAGHGNEIAAIEKNNFDAIVAVGGDGSVNEIGSALINSTCALGIIPCGSGNGLARHLKIPLKIKDAITLINHWNIQKNDTGIVNEIPFLGTCGVGFDAHIAKKFDEFHKRGFISYIKLVMKEFKLYNPFRIEAKIGDQKIKRNVMMACIANATQFGNGFYISPDSKSNDGFFELVFLDKFSLAKALKIGYQFFTKNITKSTHYECLRFEDEIELIAENQTKILIQVDGEPKTTQSPLKISVLKSSLKILIPKK